MQANIQTRVPNLCHCRRSFLQASGLAASSLVFGVMICALPSPLHAAIPIPFTHHDSASMHKEVEALEQEWRQALLASNVTELDHLLADDYLGVTANGTLETKADLLAMRRSGTTKLSQLDLSDLKIRVYGDTAVVTSRAEVAGTNGGTDISGRYRYTRVYNRRNGQWRIVSFEASRMADSGRKR